MQDTHQVRVSIDLTENEKANLHRIADVMGVDPETYITGVVRAMLRLDGSITKYPQREAVESSDEEVRARLEPVALALANGPKYSEVDLQTSKKTAGQVLIEKLTADGIIGMWKDRPETQDAQNFARELRGKAWARNKD